MKLFTDFNLSKQLSDALNDLGFEIPTPIQLESFNSIKSGKDIVGISQTGTGKTLAYCLPVLNDLKYSSQINPRVLIIVPTRELVVQVVETLKKLTSYLTVRIKGIYGGVNISTQSQGLLNGSDIIVGTPRRLFDLVMQKSIQLKSVKQIIIDEVDVMLDLGFKSQISSILDLVPTKRQSIMFSATMTEDVMTLIESDFINPKKIQIAVSGTPLNNIIQSKYFVSNFFTKCNLLSYLLKDKDEYNKVLIFDSNKKNVERASVILDEKLNGGVALIHSNMSQNNRFRAIEKFKDGSNRILISTDLMARGIDLDEVSHVINLDVPLFPENYMHRIGRTGRAKNKGKSILLYTVKEEEKKKAIELLMNFEIPLIPFPENVEITSQLTPEEKPRERELNSKKVDQNEGGGAFHEKKMKNQKINLGGSYKRKMKTKYKKPKSRGDKNMNRNRS